MKDAALKFIGIFFALVSAAVWFVAILWSMLNMVNNLGNWWAFAGWALLLCFFGALGFFVYQIDVEAEKRKLP